jgi:hypothetical protein
VGDVPANPSATRWDGSPEVEGIPGRRKESPTGTVNEGGGAVSIAESSLTPVSMRCEIWGSSEVSHRARAVVGDGEQRGCLEPSGRRAWSDGLRSGGSSDASSAGNEQETLTFPSTETRGRARRRAQWPCEALDSLSLLVDGGAGRALELDLGKGERSDVQRPVGDGVRNRARGRGDALTIRARGRWSHLLAPSISGTAGWF